MKVCRLCGAKINLEDKKLELKNIPESAQNFPEEKLKIVKGRNIKVYQCKYCELIQLACEPVSYYKNVIRSTGVSDEMKKFRNKYFQDFADKYDIYNKKIIEIGAGNGEYMEMFHDATHKEIVGIEYNKDAIKKANQNGLKIYEGYIENASYKIPGAPYDIFFIMNFLEHIPNPKEFLRGIYNNLSDNAIGIIEVPNSNKIIEKKLFSEFVIDHLMYFTVDTLKLLLESCGFEVESCKIVWNGFSISAIVKKKKDSEFEGFKNKQKEICDNVNEYLDKCMEKGDIVAWGAGHVALTNLSLFKMKDKIRYIIDSAEFKQNKYTPVTYIPIVSPEILEKDKNIKTVLIMTSEYAKEISEILCQKYNVGIAVLNDDGIEIIK